MQRDLTTRKLRVCLSVRPSVCLSVKRVDCDQTEESSAQIFIPYERTLLLLLLLLHDLYSANFEDRVGGAGVARWRT